MVKSAHITAKAGAARSRLGRERLSDAGGGNGLFCFRPEARAAFYFNHNEGSCLVKKMIGLVMMLGLIVGIIGCGGDKDTTQANVDN